MANISYDVHSSSHRGARIRRIVCEVGGEQPSVILELAVATGKCRVSDLSVARNEIVRKGLALSPERGLLSFTVPGMADHVRRQT